MEQKKQQILFADVQKYVLASLPRTSYCFLNRRVPSSAKRSARKHQKSRKWCHRLAMLSKVSKETLHLSSLFCFTGAEEQSKRRVLVSGTQVHEKNIENNRK